MTISSLDLGKKIFALCNQAGDEPSFLHDKARGCLTMNNTIFGLSKKSLMVLFGTLIVFNVATWLSLIGLCSTTDASLLGIGALAYW